jgi:spore coat protein A
LVIAPAERADLIVNFAHLHGKNLILRNDAPVPFPNGTPVDPETTGQIMEFRVVLPLQQEDKSSLPDELVPVPRLDQNLVKVRRNLSMVVQRDEFGRLLFLLNGKKWHDPVTEEPRRGGVEIGNLINPGFVSHPIHLHQVQFQILNRQPFDVAHYNRTGELIFTGPPELPDHNEQGWKDTVRSKPGEVTRIIIQFGPYTGQYPWHCHLLEHEDYDMMRPFTVLSKKSKKE